MSGTCLTDLKTLYPLITANAKSVVSAKGTSLTSLVLQAEQLTSELTVILKQIYSLHPSSGGDASNYASLATIIAELA